MIHLCQFCRDCRDSGRWLGSAALSRSQPPQDTTACPVDLGARAARRAAPLRRSCEAANGCVFSCSNLQHAKRAASPKLHPYWQFAILGARCRRPKFYSHAADRASRRTPRKRGNVRFCRCPCAIVDQTLRQPPWCLTRRWVQYRWLSRRGGRTADGCQGLDAAVRGR